MKEAVVAEEISHAVSSKREYDLYQMEKYINGNKWSNKVNNQMKKSASFYIIMYFFTYNLKYESLPLGGSDLNFLI